MSSLFKVILSFVPWSIYAWVMHTPLTFRSKFVVWCLLLFFMISVNRHLIIQREAVTFSNLFSFIFIFLNWKYNWIPLVNQCPASLCYLVLTVVAAGSLVVKKPFTMRYADTSLSEEKRRHRIFYLINRNITLIWSGVFTINCILNFYYSWSVCLRLISLSLVLLALFASKYLPELMRNHYRRKLSA